MMLFINKLGMSYVVVERWNSNVCIFTVDYECGTLWELSKTNNWNSECCLL